MEQTNLKLFQPIRIGNTILKNRIVAAPITKYGYQPSPAEELETIAAKARGGAGLIVLGSVAVEDKESLIYYEASSLMGHKRPLYNELLSIIHQYGAKASVELLHCGMFADCRFSETAPVGPYTFRKEQDHFTGVEGIENNQIMDGSPVIGIDEAKMEEICEAYAASALEAKRMGFDMIMLHFAHGWLPAQFLSPFFNKRTDGYGGSFENRVRFPKMIIERVRKAVGKDYPIDMRIGAREYVEGGIELEEVIRFIQLVEEEIDMVHVSSGLDKFLVPTTYIESPSILPHQINVPFAEAVKKKVKIPVVTVGGITTPREAEQILVQEKADLIALGRGLIADPDWPKKAYSQKEDDIRTCIRCVSCYGVATHGRSQGCAVNPRYERELRLQNEELQSQCDKKLRVVVVGGGPAGMSAAIEASANGHQVILFEKTDRLGGLLTIADNDPIKSDMLNFKNYLVNQIQKSNVDVRLCHEADPKLIQELKADKVIIATGARAIQPKIKGIDSSHVLDIVKAHKMENITGTEITVIGGGPSGCELALSLAREGKKVTIVEALDSAASVGNVLYQAAMNHLLSQQAGISLMRNTRCLEIKGSSLLLDVQGTQVEQPADTVIIATGFQADVNLAETYMNTAYDVRYVGDCVNARRINEAVHEGYFAGHFL